MITAGESTITAARIKKDDVIRVERTPDGLTPTRRKRGSFEVTVTDKEAVTVPGGRQTRYVINTDGGPTVPVTGAQTFTLLAAPGADLDDVPAPTDATDQGDTWDFANDGDLWRLYRDTKEMVTAGAVPAPARSDMRPRTETFLGRRLRVERGREWGKINLLVNGQNVGSATGSDADGMNRAAEQLRRDVIAADERRVTDPDAYPAHWYRGAVELPRIMVAYARFAEELAERDRAALRAATCTDPTHTPGTLGCPAPVKTCNGIPTDLDAVIGSEVMTEPINRGTVTGETGVMHIGRCLVREFGERHTVHGLALIGDPDPYGRGNVRQFTVWALTVDGFPVHLVAYDGRETGLSPERRYAALMVGGDLVAGTLAMNQHPDELARNVAWTFRNWLADQRDVHSDPRHTWPVVTITHTAADGTIIRGINGADGEHIGLGSTDAHTLSKHLWHWSAGAGAWVLPLSAGRRPNVDKITNTRTLIERDNRKVTVSMADHDTIPTSGPETPAPGPWSGELPAEAPAPAVEGADQGGAVAPSLTTVPESGGADPGPVVVAVVSHGDITDRAPDAEAPAPAVGDADQVDPTVRDMIARGWWDIQTVRTGRGRAATRVTGHVFHLPRDAGRLDYDLFRKISDQVQQIGGSRWNKEARGWLFAGSEITWNGTGAGGRTKSGQERVAEWLAASVPMVDGVPQMPDTYDPRAGVAAELASAHGTADGPAPAAELPAEAPAVPTLDGVPAGLPYVVDMPADWPTAPVTLEAKTVAKILRTEVLPAWFPGVKFSARTATGSMYLAVDIYWTDGPAGTVVSLVANQWQGKFYDSQHESTSYRGPILYVNAAGQATAYRLPGVTLSTHRETSDVAAMAAMAAFLKDVPDPIPHGDFVDPFGKTWSGGSRADCARWMASFGIDEWTRANRLDPRRKCPVERCALAAGHPWHVHRNDYGTPFLATLPDDGPDGGDGGQPTDGPTDPTPTGPTFSTWEELAAWIDAGRPAVVDQVDTVPAPAVDQAGSVPAGRPFTVTNDGRGNIRVHRPGCRDIRSDSAGTGAAWDVTVPDLRTIVIDLYTGFEDFTAENWADWSGDISVMPCAGDLPDVATPAPAPAMPAPVPGNRVTVTGWQGSHFVLAVTDGRAIVTSAGETHRIGLDRVATVEELTTDQVAREVAAALADRLPEDGLAAARVLADQVGGVWKVETQEDTRPIMVHDVYTDRAHATRVAVELADTGRFDMVRVVNTEGWTRAEWFRGLDVGWKEWGGVAEEDRGWTVRAVAAHQQYVADQVARAADRSDLNVWQLVTFNGAIQVAERRGSFEHDHDAGHAAMCAVWPRANAPRHLRAYLVRVTDQATAVHVYTDADPIAVFPHDPGSDTPAADQGTDPAPAPAETPAAGPVPVADLVRGDRAYVVGIDQFGKPTMAWGYVTGAPSTVNVHGLTRAGRRSKDPKKSRPGLLVQVNEFLDGMNGTRCTVVTLPDAYAERLTDGEHEFRPTLVDRDADAVIGRCSCGKYTAPAAPSTWLAARARWQSQHATPAPVVSAVTPDLIARAEQIGRDAYDQGHPVSAAPATHPDIMAMVEGWAVGAGAAEIFAAYTRGHAAAADRAAESALYSVNIGRINTVDAEKIAERNPAAQECADIAAAGLASSWRNLADRTADAVTARAAVDGDEREDRIVRTIAQSIAEKLSADPDMGEILGRRGLSADDVADLVEQSRTLPYDEVRRLVTRLRAAYDHDKHARYGGKDMPYGPATIPTPVNGTPVHVWEYQGTRYTITAVSVVPHLMISVDGTGGYESLRLTNGAQIVARSVAPDREAAYRVFWRIDGGEWRSATGDLTGEEYRRWNGWPSDPGMIAGALPTGTVAAWLDQVMQATADDAAWSAAAPAPAAEEPETLDQVRARIRAKLDAEQAARVTAARRAGELAGLAGGLGAPSANPEVCRLLSQIGDDPDRAQTREIETAYAAAFHAAAGTVPPINSNIPHRFQPNTDGTKDDNGVPVYCVPPCHGHVSMPFHITDGGPDTPTTPEPPAPTGDAPATIRPVIKAQPWVTAHLDHAPTEAPAGADQDSTPATPGTSGSVDQEPPAGAKPRKRPAVGAYIWHPEHGVCEVLAVHGRGGDIAVRTPAGERLELNRHWRDSWSVVAAPAPAVDQEDTDDGDAAGDDEPRSIYRLPLEAYTPELDSDDDPAIIIRHDHEDGTVIDGSRRGDGVLEIAGRHGFECRRGVIFRRYSRDRFADLVVIGKLAAELREAGHTVGVEVDDVWRPAAVREDARALRSSARAERLAARATKKFAEANARRLAARGIADGMPFGEPIKVGHHSERAHRRAFERIEANDRASYAARDYAEELARRADAAERNEAARHGGRAIMRRIDTLKAERRRWIRRLADTDRGTTGYARTCRLHIEQISEDIAFQVAKLGDMAAAGAFVAWSAETIRRDDLVNVGGWKRVARVNRKGVSVRGLYQWHTDDDVTPVTWDQIFGRRRDGMQLDTPNGQAWPVDQADRVQRWADLVSRYETCTSYDRTDEELRRRRHLAQARRIVLGLDRKATAQEVHAFEQPATVEDRRAVALASLDAYTRLEAGERFEQVAAAVTPPVALTAAWRMPTGEPVDTKPADLVPGDIVAGVWDTFASMRTVSTSIVGPVETVPRHEDRRESGDWYTVRINGDEQEIRGSRWLLVHRSGNR